MYMKYLIISISLTYYLVLTSTSSKEYGLLTVSVTKFGLCRGPKRRDCCVPAVRLSEGVRLTYDFLVKEDFILSNGKIVATTGGKEMVKFQMKKPCDHFLLKTLYQMYLNVTETCTISKGHYVFTANVQEIAEIYYGGKYFYGNWTFKSIFYGNECNFFCTLMDVVMIPRKKT